MDVASICVSPIAVEQEAERLFRLLLHVDCGPSGPWTLGRCHDIAPLTLEIAQLKADRQALVLAHSYVEPEIVYGVADIRGDSYYLSRMARESGAQTIVLAGVRFMAETVKILAPTATVLVPDREAGCSLADSLTGEQLRQLKAQYPDAAVVCYVNSTADVKAESDVCVTSANAAAIVAQLPEQQILFVPDRLMGQNLALELQAQGINKQIVTSDGTCLVHDRFGVDAITRARIQFPGLAVVAHPECPPDVAAHADYVGSTGGMMKFVKSSAAPHYLMLTECGLVSRLQVEAPDKRFLGGCRLCPHMKRNSLENLRDALATPRPDQIISIPEDVRLRAAHCLDRMFALAPVAA